MKLYSHLSLTLNTSREKKFKFFLKKKNPKKSKAISIYDKCVTFVCTHISVVFIARISDYICK